VNSSSLTAHPICIFVGTWTLVFLLYGLGLSGQLIFDVEDFLYLYALIVCGFLFAYFCTHQLLVLASRSGSSPPPRPQASTLDPSDAWARAVMLQRARGLLELWAIATVLEVIVSGGVPIVWLFTGNPKTYQDFGIPSVHGLLISMLLACAMLSFYLYLDTGRRRYLATPACALLWFVISVTRAFFIGLLLQMLFLYLVKRRLTTGQVTKIAIGFLLVVVAFGALGDFRQGSADLIRSLAKPTSRYPDWLPSGFLWVYIYLATPLNNLFNTIQLSPSIDGISLAATTSQLLPSFIRHVIFPASFATQGTLVDTSLNVSTSFAPPYLDMGLLGIVLYAALFGIAGGVFWFFRRDHYYALGYSFIAQALALSIFFSFLLNLPFLFQLVWFRYLLRPAAAPSSTAISRAA